MYNTCITCHWSWGGSLVQHITLTNTNMIMAFCYRNQCFSRTGYECECQYLITSVSEHLLNIFVSNVQAVGTLCQYAICDIRRYDILYSYMTWIFAMKIRKGQILSVFECVVYLGICWSNATIGQYYLVSDKRRWKPLDECRFQLVNLEVIGEGSTNSCDRQIDRWLYILCS